jgi:hypothetical protein
MVKLLLFLLDNVSLYSELFPVRLNLQNYGWSCSPTTKGGGDVG